MKIIALSDIHAAYATAVAVLRKERPDLLILAGDITTMGPSSEMEEALRMFRAECPEILAVAGNMDRPRQDEVLERLGVSVNGRGVAVGEIGVFGVSGAPVSPLRTVYEITEEEIARRAESGHAAVRACSRKIFVPHAPPYGTKVDIIHAGIHVGSAAVRDFIEEHEPDLVICGHIHEARGVDKIGTTTIVNCGPLFRGSYARIETEPEIRVELMSISVIPL